MNCHWGTSLVVQWLRLCAPSKVISGLIPGQGTKISHVAWSKDKKNHAEVTLTAPNGR